MCGIAGVIRRNARPNSQTLSTLATALDHRGPDDSGIYTHNGVGLVHTRLSIIDLKGGHQPIMGKDGQSALVANGEVYNYLELQPALSESGYPCQSGSDSETIMRCYERGGVESVRDLNGMFAYALYDATTQCVHLVRDRLGIKPLFYCRQGDEIFFASEIKALIAAMPQALDVDPEALCQFLEHQFYSPSHCIVSGIQQVPPASILTIDADLNIRTQCYWQASDIEPNQMDLQEAVCRFDGLMEKVMKEHMRSDVPYGLFLSGGIDSGLLCAMLNEYQSARIETYSVGFEEDVGELDAAQVVADRFKTHHRKLVLTSEDLAGRMVHMTWAADDLMRDYACLPTSWLCSSAASNLKVVLSGEGGDEAFAGYRRYNAPLYGRLLKNWHKPGTGGFRIHGDWSDNSLDAIFSETLSTALPASRAPMIETWQQLPKQWSFMQKAQWLDIQHALHSNLLVKADRMSMGFGLEVRVPFCDHRVLAFGLALPDNVKVQGGKGKFLLRQWAKQWLPKSHLEAKKRGFHVPMAPVFSGQRLGQLSRRISRNRAIKEWLRPEGVQQLFARQAKKGDVTRQVFALTQFALWHELFIEQRGREVPRRQENLIDWLP